MKNRVTLNNIVSGLILQIITVISGFIIPKIILIYFGSSVNGLVSSINQFLSYITLVEGGVTGVIAANMYRPLVNKDYTRLSSIVVTAKKFFNKIGMIFVGYAVILALIYPLFTDTGFDYLYVSTLILVLSISLSVQYMFSLTLKTLLIADKRAYIVSYTQILICVSNLILVYISVLIYPSIHILKVITGGLYVFQPFIFGQYVRKHYDICWKSQSDNNLISERWNGFAINIAAFVHNCTDVTLLTLFSTLKMVSIYSVYSLVTNGLKQLINAVTSGIDSTLGQAYAIGDERELNKRMDLYEYIIFMIVGLSFTMAGLLITPFVMIYTKGVTDADYYQPLFGVMIVISEAIYLLKYPHLNLAYAANKFKEITVPACIEAVINIVISLILIKKYGLIGVSIGTITAMTYRMVFHIYYTSKLIEGRKQWIFYRKLIIFTVATVLGIIICYTCFPLRTFTITLWMVRAIEYALVLAVVYGAMSLLIFRNEVNFIIHYLIKR